MKKIFYALMLLSLVFIGCKKDDDSSSSSSSSSTGSYSTIVFELKLYRSSNFANNGDFFVGPMTSGGGLPCPRTLNLEINLYKNYNFNFSTLEVEYDDLATKKGVVINSDGTNNNTDFFGADDSLSILLDITDDIIGVDDWSFEIQPEYHYYSVYECTGTEDNYTFWDGNNSPGATGTKGGGWMEEYYYNGPFGIGQSWLNLDPVDRYYIKNDTLFLTGVLGY